MNRIHYFKPNLDEVHGPRGTVMVYEPGVVDDSMVVATQAESNLVSSEVAGGVTAIDYTDHWGNRPGEGERLHAVALDLDVPARLVPSSTPGHFHLYIDVPMTWDAYEELLSSLVNAGIVEPGYAEASHAQGKTLLRTKPRPTVKVGDGYPVTPGDWLD